MAANKQPSTSFSTTKVNSTTFAIREDDAYEEHPLIYVKIHPRVPLVVVSDTGSDEPSEKHKNGRLLARTREHATPSCVRVKATICYHGPAVFVERNMTFDFDWC